MPKIKNIKSTNVEQLEETIVVNETVNVETVNNITEIFDESNVDTSLNTAETVIGCVHTSTNNEKLKVTKSAKPSSYIPPISKPNKEIKKDNNKNINKNTNFVNSTRYNKDDVKPANLPKHIEDIVCYIKFNASIRRHASLNIIDNLIESGDIVENKSKYVDFLWKKIRVHNDDLIKEYSYEDNVFLEALAKAVVDVANDIQRDINVLIDEFNKNLKK